MPGPNPFNIRPEIVAERESDYTGGELTGLLAPVLGMDVDQIDGIAIVARVNGSQYTLGGTHGIEAAKLILCGAIMNGLLNV